MESRCVRDGKGLEMNAMEKNLRAEVDRIEGQWVVLLLAGHEVSIPRGALPDAVREGSQVELSIAVSEPDEGVQRRISELQNKLNSSEEEDFSF